MYFNLQFDKSGFDFHLHAVKLKYLNLILYIKLEILFYCLYFELKQIYDDIVVDIEAN